MPPQRDSHWLQRCTSVMWWKPTRPRLSTGVKGKTRGRHCVTTFSVSAWRIQHVASAGPPSGTGSVFTTEKIKTAAETRAYTTISPRRFNYRAKSMLNISYCKKTSGKVNILGSTALTCGSHTQRSENETQHLFPLWKRFPALAFFSASFFHFWAPSNPSMAAPNRIAWKRESANEMDVLHAMTSRAVPVPLYLVPMYFWLIRLVCTLRGEGMLLRDKMSCFFVITQSADSDLLEV